MDVKAVPAPYPVQWRDVCVGDVIVGTGERIGPAKNGPINFVSFPGNIKYRVNAVDDDDPMMPFRGRQLFNGKDDSESSWLPVKGDFIWIESSEGHRGPAAQRHPHICPNCRVPAYVGFREIEHADGRVACLKREESDSP